ncbi:Glucosamine--fructose-6-phosphate aminotransferase [isomerizing] [Pseudonocardia sp. Ae168_Ps1]|uniref:glutamine--fructose-6-phosphate transaminase (isomerizing) n=1 Tax=unclassified Pseudonocardia TaxID=2619320 RepID=UPI00094A9B57|nr:MULTISPECIES: glutamine--fructose-6-phosphate transaminase (isomerizing) [unclassified Pseudonocardia]OLL76922.1 Glucosamine--fructose-6-phosphate aminotransferase [isomerizing] [Pseudonocardia sp. Ae150A_Ps1]OLL82938.1 Glucosamine--fructose-6-phosphate aminotransferase [isomerizing] [Pseudonocardia sp. Ae168_Ps1]OLL82953.1 Glucosamine--fructose-6-phosphate aminotransferase [isomerizing] [Pseudonocardia sp. Ae263_Ps1]OLL91009.1 Glucosamine--fructose-6-phosphate aminotransferase [isomerizing]
MCGIVGYVGPREAAAVLLDGLARLEYRGYDSAGLAVVHRRRVTVRRTAGRVDDLRDVLGDEPPRGRTGIAHTRWATHGEPSEGNAHPHTDASGRIAVVHNGIIENADGLRTGLVARGVRPVSDTDTEVLPHLIAEAFDAGAPTLADAVRTALAPVEGTYGLAVVDAHRPEEIVVARNGSPIVLGIGGSEMVVASDLAAVVRHTRQVVFLDDGELVTVRADGIEGATRIPPTTVDTESKDYALGRHPDFLAKEIAEQPDAVRRALAGRLDTRFSTTRLGGLELDPRDLRGVRRVLFLGCGSAYYAGEIGAGLVEELARIPASAEPAGEFRHRNPVVDPDCLYVAVSQSGETADTLSCVQELRRKGGRVIGAVNVIGSAISRECGAGVFLHSGPEVSVASTKAVTNMAVSFAMLAVLLGRVRDLSVADGRRVVEALAALPGHIDTVLEQDGEIAEVAKRYADASSMFFVGRTRCSPVAREGAQKLKEISYVHAEAYPASELKHGPLALITPEMPSVVLVPGDDLFAKNIGTIEQIRARGGPVIAVTDTDLPDGLADAVLRVPRTEPELAPLLLTVPLQMLARHVAVALGRDVDKPRNLAKSVTVE